MTLSEISVRRPVLAAVAAIVLVVIGAAAFFLLPVRELPDIDPPIVSISTDYAGASAEVIESRITEPIEQQEEGGRPDDDQHDGGDRRQHRAPDGDLGERHRGAPPPMRTGAPG